MDHAFKAIKQAREALESAVIDPFGSSHKLDDAAEELRKCMNSLEAGLHADQLRDLYNAVTQARNASTQPNNVEAIQHSFEQALKACDQAEESMGFGLV